MSWDILIQDLPKDAQSVEDIPDNFQPRPLGPRAEVIARIQALLPETDFSDPTWGLLDKPDFSIEFSMGEEDMCNSIMLHVRGGGEAMATIARLLEHLQLRAIDCQAGEFFSLEAGQGSFDQWKAYRNRVIGEAGE